MTGCTALARAKAPHRIRVKAVKRVILISSVEIGKV
jgi:hypothetical protein